MKLLIAGSRGFHDFNRLRIEVNDFIEELNIEIEAIISGTASGADRLGERYAFRNEIPLIRMPADWNTFGRYAGRERNTRMALKADIAIIFWDGASKGSYDMINKCKKKGIPFRVVEYNEGD